MDFPIVQVNWKSVHINQNFCVLSLGTACSPAGLPCPGCEEMDANERRNEVLLLGVFASGFLGVTHPAFLLLGEELSPMTIQCNNKNIWKTIFFS